MATTDRLLAERAFHDSQARNRRATFFRQPEELRFADNAYLDHETWVRPALEHLGEVSGRRVLDYGCGHGMAAIVLARRGARVTGFDLSGKYLEEARWRAEANAVVIDWAQADGEHLPFADQTFHGIWGNAVLHHLDLRSAARELHRVLRPGGVAVFCEPWGENPLLNWARNQLPYSGKQRTTDEEPLSRRHILQLREVFPRVEVRGVQLLSMVRRVLRSGRLVAGLERCDALLLARLPALQRLCRYVVLTMRRPIL